MEKGVIMEIGKTKAVVLTKGGSFKQVQLPRNHIYTVGEEIDIPTYKKKHWRQITTIAASAAALFLIIFTSLLTVRSDEVAAYVTLDINPSIEAGINSSLEVVKLKSLNDDGAKILAKLGDERNVPLDLFIEKAVTVSKQSGYLQINHDILITTITQIENETTNQSIKANVEKVKEKLTSSALTVDALQGDENVREKATEQGLSSGKYLLYQQTQQKNIPMTVEEVKTLSVTEIKEKMKAHANKQDKVNKKQTKVVKQNQKEQDKDKDKEAKEKDKEKDKEKEDKGKREKDKTGKEDNKEGKGKGKKQEKDKEEKDHNKSDDEKYDNENNKQNVIKLEINVEERDKEDNKEQNED